jgi:hypothetical protein
MSTETYSAYKGIKLKPTGFVDYLLQTVGFFRLEKVVTVKKAHSGEERQIWVFVK